MPNVSNDPEEAHIGKDLGSRQFVADDSILNDYFDGLEIDADWYDDHPYDTPVVPSMTLSSVDGGFPGGGFKNAFGNLWMRQQWTMNAPIIPGRPYQATSRVVDIYEHRNRTLVNSEVVLWSPDGDATAVGNHHQSYLLTQSSGKVALRDPKAKGGSRRFSIPKGDLIEGDSHKISLEMCGTFFHGNANYHTDRRAAEELGFEEVVVGGRMTMSYIGDLMDRSFGKGWFEGGVLDIKFTNIVWPDDIVTPNVVITEEATDNGTRRANGSIWMEKEDGTVVIVGTVSAIV